MSGQFLHHFRISSFYFHLTAFFLSLSASLLNYPYFILSSHFVLLIRAEHLRIDFAKTSIFSSLILFVECFTIFRFFGDFRVSFLTCCHVSFFPDAAKKPTNKPNTLLRDQIRWWKRKHYRLLRIVHCSHNSTNLVKSDAWKLPKWGHSRAFGNQHHRSAQYDQLAKIMLKSRKRIFLWVVPLMSFEIPLLVSYNDARYRLILEERRETVSLLIERYVDIKMCKLLTRWVQLYREIWLAPRQVAAR